MGPRKVKFQGNGDNFITRRQESCAARIEETVTIENWVLMFKKRQTIP
jgi:hypothetical protein